MDACERKEGKGVARPPQVVADGQPLHPQYFTFGNTAVQKIEGWLFLRSALGSSTGGGCQQERTDLLLAYDIPVHVSIAEFYDFLQDSDVAAESPRNDTTLPASDGLERADGCADLGSITHLQVLNSVRAPDTYAILMKIRSAEAGAALHAQLHGRPFNELESDVARFAFVSDVRFAQPGKFDFPPAPPPRSSDACVCPVCLERMDPSRHALISILCNHQFHFGCLAKWADSTTCPVCRFVMQPAAPSFCAVCGIRESLWLCMLCGHVGCGRYTGGHAVAHFNATGHAFALDLLTQRAWDYAADGWVHRLIATHSADKLVEWLRQRERRGDAAPLELPRVVEHFTSVKLEHLIGEFNFLLSSQLGRQRAHFQAALSAAVERHKRHLSRLRDDISRMEEALAHLRNSQIAAQDDLERHRARCAEAELALASVNAQLSKLHRLNSSLLEQQSHLRVDLEFHGKRVQAERDAALASKDAEIAQLEEQIQDISFAIRTHRAISRSFLKHDLTDAKFYMVNEAPGGSSSARDRLRKKLTRAGRPG